jgi:thiosulfate reductase cytochrome b subunit
MGLVALARDTMRTERYEITSHLSVDSIVERAREAGAAGLHTNFAPWGALVRGRANHNRIVMVRRSIVNNSWRPYLFAAPTATDGSTVLAIEIRPPVATTVIMWLLVPFGLVFCIAALATGQVLGLVGLLIPLWGLLVTAFGGWVARKDRAMLTSVIEDVAHAPARPA